MSNGTANNVSQHSQHSQHDEFADDNTFVWDAPSASEIASSGGEGKFCKTPGTYHLLVEKLEFNPTKKQDGTTIAGVRVNFCILAGTAADQVGKMIEVTFFHPKSSDRDEGVFARRKQAALFVAIGLIHPSQLGQSMRIDPRAAAGRQCIATFAEKPFTKNDGTTGVGIELHYANIYHVDDPRAAKFPKDLEAISTIEQSVRLKADEFAVLLSSASSGVNSANGTKSSATAALAGSVANGSATKAALKTSTVSDDLGDL